jgi:hypothetical protein
VKPHILIMLDILADVSTPHDSVAVGLALGMLSEAAKS